MKMLDVVKNGVNKVGFTMQKHSPEILTGVGVTGVVGAAIWACVQTRKVDKVIAKHEERLRAIKSQKEFADTQEPEEGVDKFDYPDEEFRKDVASVYVNTGIDFAKLYGLPVALGALSISCIIGSTVIQKKRNISLAAAYATVDEAFKAYKKRVEEKYGVDAERDIRFGVKEKEVEETTVNKKGEEVTKTKKVKAIDYSDPSTYSPYAKFFDSSSPYWQDDAEYNRMFLNQVEETANQRLKAKGKLFLNEVYQLLGMQTTKAGQIVGWVYDKHNPIGDNEVRLMGIYNVNSEAARDFVNGFEPVVLIDFNVDGNIWELENTWN